MKLAAEACVAFERDINLFVDHELPDAQSGRLVEHLQSCGSCRDYVDDLRELAEMHRETASTEAERRAARRYADDCSRRAFHLFA